MNTLEKRFSKKYTSVEKILAKKTQKNATMFMVLRGARWEGLSRGREFYGRGGRKHPKEKNTKIRYIQEAENEEDSMVVEGYHKFTVSIVWSMSVMLLIFYEHLRKRWTMLIKEMISCWHSKMIATKRLYGTSITWPTTICVPNLFVKWTTYKWLDDIWWFLQNSS